MPFIFLGAVLSVILFILLISIYIDGRRPFYRLVKMGDRYIIQYRKWWILWRTYTLVNTGEPAVYYVQTEAEDMIQTLVERRKTTRNLDKRVSGSKIEVFNYSDTGKRMGKK